MPYDFHRRIIGQQGKDVRAMMKQFDVNISIPPPEEHSDKVKVTGPPNNVKNAIEALQKKCEQLELEKEERVRYLFIDVTYLSTFTEVDIVLVILLYFYHYDLRKAVLCFKCVISF